MANVHRAVGYLTQDIVTAAASVAVDYFVAAGAPGNRPLSRSNLASYLLFRQSTHKAQEPLGVSFIVMDVVDILPCRAVLISR